MEEVVIWGLTKTELLRFSELFVLAVIALSIILFVIKPMTNFAFKILNNYAKSKMASAGNAPIPITLWGYILLLITYLLLLASTIYFGMGRDAAEYHNQIETQTDKLVGSGDPFIWGLEKFEFLLVAEEFTLLTVLILFTALTVNPLIVGVFESVNRFLQPRQVKGITVATIGTIIVVFLFRNIQLISEVVEKL